ncbi:Protein arg-6, mitochondrial [Epichloe bromicola]|uniref:Protein arg-6, mitochondrial n=1 Tax=Epichloe bromicola TaxID=79588 RepID=A0ABQ0CGC3_9HYPO
MARRQKTINQQRRGYATTTKFNSVLDKKKASSDVPARVGLIGAQRYTGHVMEHATDQERIWEQRARCSIQESPAYEQDDG